MDPAAGSRMRVLGGTAQREPIANLGLLGRRCRTAASSRPRGSLRRRGARFRCCRTPGPPVLRGSCAHRAQGGHVGRHLTGQENPTTGRSHRATARSAGSSSRCSSRPVSRSSTSPARSSTVPTRASDDDDGSGQHVRALPSLLRPEPPLSHLRQELSPSSTVLSNASPIEGEGGLPDGNASSCTVTGTTPGCSIRGSRRSGCRSR
jgi:hypothetical protein